MDFRWGWYCSRSNGSLDLRIIERPLDKAMFGEFRDLTRVVETLRPYLIDFLALRADDSAVASVEREVAEGMNGLMVEGMPSIPRTVAVQTRAQRAVSNYLGAASAFRERATRRMCRDFGKGSAEYLAFKARLSHHYDASFSYRLLYALRNHSQHQENPLSLVATTAMRDEDKVMRASVRLELHVEQLSGNPAIKAAVRKELLGIADPVIHLTPWIAEHTHQLADVFALLIELHREAITKMAQYGAALYREMQVPHDCQPVIFEGPKPVDGPQGQRRMIMSGFDELNRLLEIRAEIRGSPAW